jgi:hypothetical protein
VGGKISVEMVEITWVEDLWSSPKSSRRLPTDTLNTKVTQIKIFTHINFLGNQLIWTTLTFYYKFSMG